ncbi:MAG TPA: ABC transporter ATP-binding protein [Pyrinomonadaceae bacterium]|jgi:putative ABC transport system ATP-binding protein
MLRAIELSKTYRSGADEYRALANATVEIDADDLLAIVGKSGSGKSTLMHLLACLDQPSSGRITFEGEDVNAFSQGKLNRFRNETFGFVFQQFFLNGRDSVLENVVLPLKIRGLSAADRHAKGMEYLRAVGLEDKARKAAKDLSGGEKQRVCIARALVAEPRVIFADEPTGNLDSVTGRMVEETLFRLNREQGIAVVIVTHDDELAAKCDRRIELKDGEIIAERSRETARG